MKKKDERNRKIMELLDMGEKMSVISRQYGISATRVQQIRDKYKKPEAGVDPLYAELSSRTSNSLQRFGITSLKTIESFNYEDSKVPLSSCQQGRYKSFGIKSLVETCSICRKYGIDYKKLVDDYIKRKGLVDQADDVYAVIQKLTQN